MKNAILTLALLLGALGAWAQTDSVPPKPETFWTTVDGEILLGYADYKGNTEKIDLTYGFKISKKWTKNTLAIAAGGAYGEVRGVRNQENYNASIFDELTINDYLGAYGKYGFLKDPIAGYEAVHRIGAGALLTAIDKPTFSFKARLGYEYRSEDRVVEEGLQRNVVTANTGKAGFRLMFVVMENVKFTSEVNYQHDFQNQDNYFADALAKAVFSVNKAIDIEVAYFVDYRNIPPGETFLQKDTRFTSTLKIKF